MTPRTPHRLAGYVSTPEMRQRYDQVFRDQPICKPTLMERLARAAGMVC